MHVHIIYVCALDSVQSDFVLSLKHKHTHTHTNIHKYLFSMRKHFYLFCYLFVCTFFLIMCFVVYLYLFFISVKWNCQGVWAESKWSPAFCPVAYYSLFFLCWQWKRWAECLNWWVDMWLLTPWCFCTEPESHLRLFAFVETHIEFMELQYWVSVCEVNWIWWLS